MIANVTYSIKLKKAPGFRQASLFKKVLALLDRHHIRLPALRFVVDLFDKKVLRDIVLEDDEDFDTTIQEVNR